MPLFVLMYLSILSISTAFGAEVLQGPFDAPEGLVDYERLSGWPAYHQDSANNYYRGMNPSHISQCTWFVAAVHPDDILPFVTGLGYARRWFEALGNPKAGYRTAKWSDGASPEVGAIAVWDDSVGGGAGHVAYVTQVNERNKFAVWDSNWGSESKDNDLTNGRIRERLLKDKADFEGLIGFVYPKTPPVDINCFALMLDVSGSMSEENKLGQAQRAASAFVDSLTNNDKVALVVFSSVANVLLSLETLQDSSRQNLKTKISQTEPLGSTNIGDGLRLGLLEVRKDQSPDSKRGLLLSDGMHNEGELWPFVEEWTRAGLKVDAVAFGTDADRQQLTEIASKTGGKMFPADSGNLTHIWQTILAESRGQTLLLNVQDYAFGPVSYPVEVDTASQKLTVFLDGQSNVELIAPDGKVVIPKAVSGQNYGAFEVNNPLPGKWQVKTSGSGQLNLGVAVSSPLFVNFLPLEPTNQTGRAVRIGVEIKKNQNNTLSAVPGLRSVSMRIAKPKPDWLALVTGAKKPAAGDLLNLLSPYEKITLYDDGLHNDGQAGDGIFANAYQGADIAGGYLLNLNLGLKLQGQQFNRQLFSSLQIGNLTENPLTFADFLHHLVD